MCVYIYSPGNHIKVDYLVESVKLFHRGSSQIIIDLLLTNKSPSEIKKIYLLFPHRLRNIGFNKEERKFYSVALGTFEDISHTYVDRDSEYNKLYNQPGTAIEIGKSLTDGALPLTIKSPDPAYPFKNIPYQGIMIGKSVIQFNDDIDLLSWKILHDLDFSVLVCEFEYPLEFDKARWFRWKIYTQNAAKDTFSKFQYIKKWLFNELVLRYEIIGPFDIQYRFYTRLECFEIECTKNNKIGAQLLFKAQGLIRNIASKGYLTDHTELSIPDCRINLFPHDYQEITNTILAGDVEVCGASPNYFDEYIYQWKAGSNIVKNKNEGRFSIGFNARHISKFSKWIPILGIILAIFSILLTVFFGITC